MTDAGGQGCAGVQGKGLELTGEGCGEGWGLSFQAKPLGQQA